MKGNEMMKWLLIAGAVYLVYRYMQAQNAAAAPAGTPAALPAATTEVLAASETMDNKPADFVELTRDQLHQYAASRMPPTWDGRLNASQWNWMTSQLSGKDQQATLPVGDETITAAEYLALRKGAGISGLMQAFGGYQPMASNWAM